MKKLVFKEEKIAAVIHFIKGQKIILNDDLALLYAVASCVLKQGVKKP